jgi:diguanylate cyclase (GGDEF)-like protein
MTMSSWERTFKELKDRFVEGSAARLIRLSATLDQLEQNPTESDALSDLLRQFHGLSGLGTTYGFPRVTVLGYQGERECDQLIQDKTFPKNTDIRRWRSVLEALRAEFVKAEGREDKVVEETVVEAGDSPARRYEVLLVDQNGDLDFVTPALTSMEGVVIRNVHSKAEAISTLAERLPDAVITDAYLPDGSAYELVEYVRSQPSGDMPAVLVVSGQTGFVDKVEAIRCGADGYFERPVNCEAVARRLQVLWSRTKQESARILSVEDDPDQASFIRAFLESAGYNVHVCNDPKRFAVDLVSFRPDLVLLDIMLPGMSGYDLARYLRQQEAYATLPVLFLSSQWKLQVKIETLRAGGNDHLVKPVPAGLLLSTVAAHLERARFLHSLMDRDGLTRLLTHTAFLERADEIVSIAHRRPSMSCAMVMIDLDDFQAVNDRYGPLVGDRVILELGSLLRRRLRYHDLVSRFGGEKFALVVEDLSQEEAVRLCSRLLGEFSAIDQAGENGAIFHTTFSAGVAMLNPRTMNLLRWKELATEALNIAKGAGKNCVIAATDPDAAAAKTPIPPLKFQERRKRPVS